MRIRWFVGVPPWVALWFWLPSRMVWTAVERLAGWADAGGIGRRPVP